MVLKSAVQKLWFFWVCSIPLTEEYYLLASFVSLLSSVMAGTGQIYLSAGCCFREVFMIWKLCLSSFRYEMPSVERLELWNQCWCLPEVTWEPRAVQAEPFHAGPCAVVPEEAACAGSGLFLAELVCPKLLTVPFLGEPTAWHAPARCLCRDQEIEKKR